MLMKWLMRRRLAAFERAYDYDMGYVHAMLDADPAAVKLFGRLIALGGYRRNVPLAPWYAAKIAATLAEDCGPCTQLAVTMAERAGVDSTVLKAIVVRDLMALPRDVALAFRFAEASLRRDPAADALRDEIVVRWGMCGLMSLGFAIAAGRIFPTIKYALGHGTACTRVAVGGRPVAVLREAA
jgi:hypothetical protein